TVATTLVRPVASVSSSPHASSNSTVTSHVVQPHEGLVAGCGGTGGAGGTSRDESCSATSTADWMRCVGPLARSPSMSASTSAGTFGLISRIGACGVNATSCSVATDVLATNGGRPAHMAYSMAPRLNRSLRASTGPPAVCSGDMYCGVPASTTGWLCEASSA